MYYLASVVLSSVREIASRPVEINTECSDVSKYRLLAYVKGYVAE